MHLTADPQNTWSKAEKELKVGIDDSKIIVGDFNTPLSVMDRTTRQKISKETEYLNNTINQLDLTDTYRTHHPTTSSQAHNKHVHSSIIHSDQNIEVTWMSINWCVNKQNMLYIGLAKKFVQVFP